MGLGRAAVRGTTAGLFPGRHRVHDRPRRPHDRRDPVEQPRQRRGGEEEDDVLEERELLAAEEDDEGDRRDDGGGEGREEEGRPEAARLPHVLGRLGLAAEEVPDERDEHADDGRGRDGGAVGAYELFDRGLEERDVVGEVVPEHEAEDDPEDAREAEREEVVEGGRAHGCYCLVTERTARPMSGRCTVAGAWTRSFMSRSRLSVLLASTSAVGFVVERSRTHAGGVRPSTPPAWKRRREVGRASWGGRVWVARSCCGFRDEAGGLWVGGRVEQL